MAYAEAILVHQSRVEEARELVARFHLGVEVVPFQKRPSPTRYVKGLFLPPLTMEQLPRSPYPLITKGMVLGEVGKPQLCYATDDDTYQEGYKTLLPKYVGKPIGEYQQILREW
jgi:hypothetical protein